MSDRRRRIRVVRTSAPRSSFAERLEARARKIASRSQRSAWHRSMASGLEREIALAIDQLDSVKRLHRALERELIRIECYIGTEIIQREPPIPVYMDPRLPERDMLRARLLKIGQERRRLALSEAEKLRDLHDRLLVLLGRHWEVAD